MGKLSKRFLDLWRDKLPLFAAAGTVYGFAVTVVFALYNGALGILYSSIWHGSICAYYILLSALRGNLIAAGKSVLKKEADAAVKYIKTVFCTTSGLMFIMNIALTLPVFLMVTDRRPVQSGLIPAIASAAYTTYKVSLAAVRVRKSGNDFLLRELRVMQLIDALVSVLVLQNTLIVAVDGEVSQSMFTLAAISSAGIMLLIFSVSVLWFVRGLSICRKSS